MAQSNVVEQQLSREELQALRNKRSGLAIFQLSWILVFVCIVIVNWQLRSSQPAWPPAGVEAPSAVAPTLATGALLISLWFTRRAVRAVKAGDQGAFLAQWRVVLALGLAFVLVMIYEWVSMPYSGLYSDLFRMMTGFHGIHALAIGAFMGMIYRGARQYGPENFWPVEGAASLWYFVIFAWMLFYAVLYLI
jgi:heme/copper-type cytochrome/quinol oxidase subunit 3